MANHSQTGKKSVDLGAPVVRVSRIRRDPPPPVKVISAADIKDRDARDIVIGIISMALALFFLLIAFTNAAGWSLSQYTVNIK